MQEPISQIGCLPIAKIISKKYFILNNNSVSKTSLYIKIVAVKKCFKFDKKKANVAAPLK
jgi:hypothetical protein